MGETSFELTSSQTKFKVFVLFVLFVLIVLIIRLFYLQILNRSFYQELAERQQIVKIQLQGKRGEIFDRNGNILVSNVQARSFAFDPRYFKNHPELVQQLARFLNAIGIENEALTKWINSNRNFIWIKRGIVDENLKYLDTFDFPGLMKINETKRFYLFSNIASNLIGVTNIDNHGISGLEFKYDSILSGKQTQTIFFRDAQGKLKPSHSIQLAGNIDGTSIDLTIDINLQRLSEYQLEQAVKRLNAKSGCIIILDPNNGEILSLANYPNFDPNDISKVKNEDLKIVAVNSAFEPGSTIKPIIASIALENNLIDEYEIFSTFNGKLDLGDVQVLDEHPTTQVNLEEALAFSSNIAFAQIASRIPSDLLIDGLNSFGFGRRTFIELPGELPGTMKNYVELTSTQIKYIGFGYGISTTPIQLITAYSVIANGGFLIKPHLVKNFHKIGDNSQNSSNFRRRIISESTANKIKNLLTKVVEYGTGKSAKIDGILIAGKTGTAQKFIESKYSKSSYVNTFIGFYPADHPKQVILVLLEEPQNQKYAGATAAPVFRDLVLSIYNSIAIHSLLN